MLWSRADTGSVIKVSPEGYLYAAMTVPGAGQGESSLQTTKLDPDGNVLWTDVYAGPVPGENVPCSIVLDTAGNAYVIGHSSGDGTGLDIVTIKYDSDGLREWVARYDGPAMGEDYPNAAEVDHGGNVLVTGTSVGVGTQEDYVTLKYDAGGNMLWANRYTHWNVNLDDRPVAIAVDSDDCVYVTGGSSNSYFLGSDFGFGVEIVTIKYDPDGNNLWRAVYQGLIPGTSAAGVADMTMDDDGNVYIIGIDMWYVPIFWAPGMPNPFHALILKYSAAGQRIYLHEFNSLGWYEGSYTGKGILLDDNGDIIAGVETDAWHTDLDYVIVKLKEQWVPDSLNWAPAATVASDGTFVSHGRSAGIGYVSSLLIPLLAVLGLKAAGRRRRLRNLTGQ